MTDFGEVGYGGPAPPDKRHTYVFKLYALDTGLDLPGKSTKADVEKAMKGHIIAEAKLTGTYAPWKSNSVCLTFVILDIYHQEKILLGVLM